MLLPIWAAAQNAVMNVRSRQTVSAGQTFQITFDINARPDKFNLPTVKNLTIVGGPSQGYSSFDQNINGRRTVSENYTFTILVRADKEGTANVGAASCSVDGKTVSSKPFTIKVEKADPNGGHQQQQGGWGWGQPSRPSQQQQQKAQPQPKTNIDNNTLFARASINKSNLYQGEEAIIVYKIYTQVPLTQYQIEKLPRNKGFWSEDLSEDMTQVKQYTETYNCDEEGSFNAEDFVMYSHQWQWDGGKGRYKLIIETYGIDRDYMDKNEWKDKKKELKKEYKSHMSLDLLESIATSHNIPALAPSLRSAIEGLNKKK